MSAVFGIWFIILGEIGISYGNGSNLISKITVELKQIASTSASVGSPG